MTNIKQLVLNKQKCSGSDLKDSNNPTRAQAIVFCPAIMLQLNCRLPMCRCVRHWICHCSHVHWCPRNHSSRNRCSDTICHMCCCRKIYRCTNCWDKGSSYWLTYGWSAIHANTRGSRWGLRGLFGGFARGTSCRTTICLTSNWSLGCRNISVANTSDVVNARSPPIFVHWVQTNEVLLCMACHLCRCSRHHKVSWYTSPVAFPIFVQTKKK